MGRWYLVAYCLDASDWRTFRVDRISDPVITRHPCRRRESPAADLHAYVTAQIAAGMRQVTAVVRVYAPRDAVARWILPAWGTVTEETAETCIVRAGADSYQAMARWLLLLNARLTVIRPAELRAAFLELATSIARIVSDTEATQLSDGNIHTRLGPHQFSPRWHMPPVCHRGREYAARIKNLQSLAGSQCGWRGVLTRPARLPGVSRCGTRASPQSCRIFFGPRLMR
jgi:hypothetical protein